MAESRVELPPDLAKAVHDRSMIWARLDHARAQAGKLEKLAEQIPPGDAGEPIGSLTDAKDPPSELAAAIVRVESEVTQISELQQAIAAHQAEIEKTRSQGRMVLAIAITAVVLALIGIVAMLASMLR